MIHCAPCFTTNTHKVRHLSNNDETYQDTFVPFKYNKNITFNFPFSNSFHCLIIKKERFCQYTHKKREILSIIRQNLSFFIFIIQNHLIIFVNYKEKKSMTPTLINPFFFHSSFHLWNKLSNPVETPQPWLRKTFRQPNWRCCANLLLWCKTNAELWGFPNFREHVEFRCLKNFFHLVFLLVYWNQESLQVFSTFIESIQEFQIAPAPLFKFHFLNFSMLLFQCLMSVLGNQFQQPKRNNFRMINRWNIIGEHCLVDWFAEGKLCSLANTFKTFVPTLTQTILIFQFSHF